MKTSTLYICLLSSSALGLLTCGSWAQTATGGQQAAGPAPEALEEITVTARKFSENNQTTPVSVSAFTAAAMETHEIQSLGDVATETPSLVAQPSTYDPFDLYFGIRGQHSDNVILTETPSVGIYFDDVYEPSTVGTQLSNLMDIQQIEVLKGPQGTLYGRNTTGGALKITSQPPDFDAVSGQVEVGGGNYGENEVSGAINVPLSDDVAIRLTAQRIGRDGYGYDTVNNRDLDDLNSRSARAAFRYKPTSDLDVTIRADYNDARSGGLISNLAEVQPGATLGNLDAAVQNHYLTPAQAFNFLGVGAVTPADLVGLNRGYQALLAEQHDGSFTETYNEPQATRLRTGGVSATISYNLNDDLTLKSISAYRYLQRTALADTDGTSFGIVDGPADIINANQITQELQLGGHMLDNRLNWTAGYFYYRQNGTDDSPGETLFGALPLGVSPDNSRNFDTDESNSVYGQGSYALTPTVHMTEGLRWTTETIGLSSTSNQGTGAGETCQIPGLSAANCFASYSSSFRNLSYTAGLDWEVTPDVMLYGKTSRGFKSGGFNQRGTLIGTPFNPETVTDYEVGTKSEWLDHRLRINFDAYHSDYEDIQRNIVFPLNGEVVSAVRNAASATIDGLEFEMTAKPISGLTLGASGSYTLAQYVSYKSGGVDISGNPFADTPKWQASLTATYVVPTSIGGVSTTLDYNYQSKVSYAPDEATIYSGSTTTQDSYGLLNARVALDLDEQDMTIALWAKNLFDRKYNSQANDFTSNTAAGAIGIITTIPGDPRTFGIQITKHF